MKKSRLHHVLNSLSKREVRIFSDFIESPYFNHREDLIRCWKFLQEQYYQLQLIPDKKELFRAVYPGQSYDAQQARQLMSWLLKQIEQFLVCEDLLQDQQGIKLSLLRTYRHRMLPKHFRYTMRDLKKLQRKEPLRHAGYFDTNYRMHLEQYQFTAARKRIGEHNLQEISDQLDHAFISRKLRQACLSLSHQAVYKAEYEFGLLERVLSYVENGTSLDIPAIAIYYYCYRALTRPGQEDYFRLFKSMIFEHATLFPEEEIRDLYLLAINYCIKRLNEGDTDFAREGLDLYKEGLHTSILLTEQQISRFAYRNIVAMGLMVGDFDWVASFTEEYREALPKEHRESMYNFSRARLAYRQKNFDRTLELLQHTNYRDLLLNLAAKTLQLKIYFENQDWDLLHSHLEAMKHFIRRKKIMGYHQKNYLNLIRYTQKLLQINIFDKEVAGQLKKEIENEEVLTEKEWLLDKL